MYDKGAQDELEMILTSEATRSDWWVHVCA